MNKIERIYHERGFNAAYTEIIHKLEILAKKGYIIPPDLNMRYYFVNRDDKVIDGIKKAAENHEAGLPYIATGFVNYTRLYNNHDFIDVIKKMKLPLPKTN